MRGLCTFTSKCLAYYTVNVLTVSVTGLLYIETWQHRLLREGVNKIDSAYIYIYTSIVRCSFGYFLATIRSPLTRQPELPPSHHITGVASLHNNLIQITDFALQKKNVAF